MHIKNYIIALFLACLLIPLCFLHVIYITESARVIYKIFNIKHYFYIISLLISFNKSQRHSPVNIVISRSYT